MTTSSKMCKFVIDVQLVTLLATSLSTLNTLKVVISLNKFFFKALLSFSRLSNSEGEEVLKMSNKNILYGGDYERKFQYKSMGDFVVNSLRRNGDRKALVSMIMFVICESFTNEDINVNH